MTATASSTPKTFFNSLKATWEQWKGRSRRGLSDVERNSHQGAFVQFNYFGIKNSGNWFLRISHASAIVPAMPPTARNGRRHCNAMDCMTCSRHMVCGSQSDARDDKERRLMSISRNQLVVTCVVPCLWSLVSVAWWLELKIKSCLLRSSKLKPLT